MNFKNKNQNEYNRLYGLGKIIFAFTLMIIILFIGVNGFIIIEGYTFLDAIYMTVITVSTVGFGEIQELSKTGKVFTIIIIIISWITFAYAISMITSYFVEMELGGFFKKYKTKSKIKKMENHVIVVGFGRNGRQAAADLDSYNHPFIVIENNPEVIRNANETGFTFLEGDATEDEILLNAKINMAKALITTLPIDADNLFVVLSARTLNKNICLVSRAGQKASEKKLRSAGANHVVMPEIVGGEHMVSLVVNPDVVEFLDQISVKGKNQTNLEEIECSGLPDYMINLSIHELGIRKKTGANIIGFKSPDNILLIHLPQHECLKIPNFLF